MNPLDELREIVVSSADLSTKTVNAVHDLIDLFEASHPGLVDHTERCLLCNAPLNPATAPSVSNVNTGEHIGNLCPACAEEAAE